MPERRAGADGHGYEAYAGMQYAGGLLDTIKSGASAAFQYGVDTARQIGRDLSDLGRGIARGDVGYVLGGLPPVVLPEGAIAEELVLLVGGGARLENLAPGEVTRIQNAADRTGTQITVVGSRAGGTATATSDFDYVLPAGTTSSTRHSLSSSLPEGPRALGDPRNQDFFTGSVDSTKPYITFNPTPR